MFPELAQVLSNPFDMITNAYYENGKVKVYQTSKKTQSEATEELPNIQIPSTDRVQKIDDATESMDVAGKFLMTLGAGGLTIAYLVRRVPYVGKPTSVSTAVASLAVIIFGWDIQVSAYNLSTFANELYSKLEQRSKSDLPINSKTTEEQFKQKLREVSVKTTLTSEQIFKFVFAYMKAKAKAEAAALVKDGKMESKD